MSVDGFIARPDGSIDWLATVEREGEDYGYKHFIDTVDTVILGRNTYDAVLRFDAWPFAGKRCIVLTHRSAKPRPGVQHFCGTLETLVEQLGKLGARHVYVDGGAAIRGFLAAGLLDYLTVSVVPIVLGGGIPVFSDGTGERVLTLEESRAFSTGLMRLRYRVSTARQRRLGPPMAAQAASARR
jgi:dihydrofolate reductase